MKIVDKHAENALKVVADAASEATRVIACAAAEAVKVKNIEDGKDHDLLVRLEEKVEAVNNSIKELKDGTASRITKLEAEKNDIKDSYLVLYKKGVETSIDDHEKRLKSAEGSVNWIWGGLAILGVLFIIISALVSYIFISSANNSREQIQDVKVMLQGHINNKE
jgi:hypothetical protein